MTPKVPIHLSRVLIWKVFLNKKVLAVIDIMSEDYGSVDESGSVRESSEEGPEIIHELDPKGEDSGSEEEPEDSGSEEETESEKDPEENPPPPTKKAKGRKAKIVPDWEKVTDEDVERYLKLRLYLDDTSADVKLTNADFNKIKTYKKKQGSVPLPPRGPQASKVIKSKFAPRNIKSILRDAKDYADLEAEMREEGRLFEINDVTDAAMVKEMNAENALLLTEAIIENKRFKRPHKNGSKYVTTLDRTGAEIYADVWVSTEKAPEMSEKLKKIAKKAGFKYIETSTAKQQVKTKLRHLAIASDYQMWEMGGVFRGEVQQRLDELQVLLEATEAALRFRNEHGPDMEARLRSWEAVLASENTPRVDKEVARKNLDLYAKIVKASPDALDLETHEEKLVEEILRVKKERDELANRVKRIAPSQAQVRLTSKNKLLLQRRNRLEDLENELYSLEKKLESTLVVPSEGLLYEGVDLFADAEVHDVRQHYDKDTKSLQARISAIRGEMDRILYDAEERKIKPFEVTEFSTPEALVKTIILSSTVKQPPWILSVDGKFTVAQAYKVEGKMAVVVTSEWTRKYPSDKVVVAFTPETLTPNRHHPDYPEGRIVLITVRGMPCVGVITETFSNVAVVTILRSETSKLFSRHLKIVENLDLGQGIREVAASRVKAILGKFPSRVKVSYSACRRAIYESFRVVEKLPTRVFTPSLRSTVEKMYFDTLRTIIPTPKGASETPKPTKVSFETYCRRRATAEAKVEAAKTVKTKRCFQKEAEELKSREKDADALIQSIVKDFGSFGVYAGEYPSRNAFDSEFSRDAVYKLAAQISRNSISTVTRRFIAALASSPSGVGAVGIMAAAINAHLKEAAETPIEEYQTRLARAYVLSLVAQRAERLTNEYLEKRSKAYRKDYDKLYDDQGFPKIGLGSIPRAVLAQTNFSLTDEELITRVKDLVANYNPPRGGLATEYLLSGVLFPLVFLRGTLAESVAYARTKIACGDYAVEHLHRAKIHHLVPEAVMSATGDKQKMVNRTLKTIEEYFANVVMALSEGLPPERDLFDPSSSTATALGKFKPINYPDIRSLVDSLRNPVEACRMSTNTGLSFRGDFQPEAKTPKDNVTSDLIICFNKGKFVCKDKRELATRIHTSTLEEPLDERTKKVVLATYPTLDSVPIGFVPPKEVPEPDVSVGEVPESSPVHEKDPYSNVSFVYILDTTGEPMLASFEDGTVRVIYFGPPAPSSQSKLVITSSSEIPDDLTLANVVLVGTGKSEKALQKVHKNLKGRVGRLGSTVNLNETIFRSSSKVGDRLGAVFGKSVNLGLLGNRVDEYLNPVTQKLIHEALTKGKVESLWWDLQVNKILSGDYEEEDLATDEDISKLLVTPQGTQYVKSRLIAAFLGKRVPETTYTLIMQDLKSSSGVLEDEVVALGQLSIDKNIPQFADRLIAAFAVIEVSERNGWFGKLRAMTPIEILSTCENVLGPSGTSTPVNIVAPKVYTVSTASEVFTKTYRAQSKQVQISASIILGVYPPQNRQEEEQVFEAFRRIMTLNPNMIPEVVQALPRNFIGAMKVIGY